MATNEVVPGPTGRHVVENVKRLRAEKRLSLAQLADRVADAGRPIRATGLHRLENGRRRVDVDDLMALAAALDVSPITLLLPFTAQGTVELTDKIASDALVAWDWLRAVRPLDLPEEHEEAVIRAVAFQARSVPMGARALDAQLTGFFAKNEQRSEPAPLDWDAYEERHHGER